MTATINPGNTQFLEIRDSSERLFQYICSIISWIEMTNIDKIVFCENSNACYNFDRIINFASSRGKKLEVLVFNNNRNAQRFGKGYGEGEIVEYAIKNSKFLSKKDNSNVCFYKITGRIFVSNFEKIRQAHLNSANVFRIPGWLEQDNSSLINYSKHNFANNFRKKIQHFNRYLTSFDSASFREPSGSNSNAYTVFYKCNVDFYRKNLMNSYKKVRDKWGYWLEHAFYDDLVGKDFELFSEEPQVVGRSGSSGAFLSDFDFVDKVKKLAESFI